MPTASMSRKTALQRMAFSSGGLPDATRCPCGGPQSRCPLYGGVDPQPAHPGHSLYDRRGRRNSIPCAPYATFGTRELSEHVAVALKHRKATLLQHHGLIACEASTEKALWLAHEVEVWPSSTSVRWRLPTRSRCWMTRRSPSCWRSSKPTDYALKSDAATLTGEPRWQTE